MDAGRVKVLRQYFQPLLEVAAASPQWLASILRMTEEEARIVRDPLRLPDLRAKVAAQADHAITILDDDYPRLLGEIHDPPPVLHIAGSRELLNAPAIAVVGSRRASPYGVNAAKRITRDLASSGLVIVSGFARGIDAAAHAEAIAAGQPTIAVLGTGIDIDYPRGQRALRRAIESNGALVSEFAPGTPPRAMHFPIRNRIIAGMTLGTVVVEASPRSGSLITARLASEEGREVFAIPGSIFSNGSEGTHRLIQVGAKLVHEARDVLAEIEGSFVPVAPAERFNGSDDEMKLLALIEFETALHIDTIAAAAQSTPAAIAETLLRLELAGVVRAVPGQRYVRSSTMAGVS